MPIISKETWDNLIPEEEKEKVRQDYQNIIEAKRKISFTNDEISGAKYQMELLFGKENLQPQPLTYEDVARELFGKNNESWWTTNQGYISHGKLDSETKAFLNDNNCISEKQAEKLLAINKLLNVACFLNGKDWKPDWEKAQDGEDTIFGIGLDQILNEVRVFVVNPDRISTEIVYFRTEELAKRCAEILGEDTVRLALSCDF